MKHLKIIMKNLKLNMVGFLLEFPVIKVANFNCFFYLFFLEQRFVELESEYNDCRSKYENELTKCQMFKSQCGDLGK
jgi:hypothetical protein